MWISCFSRLGFRYLPSNSFQLIEGGKNVFNKNIKPEQIFYIFLEALLVCFILSESQFNELGGFGTLLKIVKFGIIGLVIILAFVRNKTVKNNFLIISLLSISVLVFNLLFNDGGLSIIPIIMLTWSSRNCSIEKIFRYTFVTVLLTCIIVMVCAAVGIVDDEVSELVRYSDAGIFAGTYNRHNMGFLMHNQVAIYFFVLYLLYILLRKGNIKWYESVIIIILNFLVLRYFGSRVVFVLITLTCIAYYIERVIERWKKKQSFSKGVVAIFPVCCIVSFYVSYSYTASSQFFRMLDKLFSNRLRLAKEALNYYGIGLIGAGKNAATYNSTELIDNTVDNGYISFFIQNGIIVGVIVIAIWTYITFLAVKNSNRYLTLGLVMIAIENLINPHLGSYLLIPFFCIVMNKNDIFVIQKDYAITKFLKNRRGPLRLRVRV